MTRNEALEILQAVKFLLPIEAYTDRAEEALDMAIEALDKPLPKPHDRLMFWETARRIIDSPRSKEQMLAVLDSVPPIEALEEVIERKRGEWIESDFGWKCSICGNTSVMWQRTYNFCPNCGAEMKHD